MSDQEEDGRSPRAGRGTTGDRTNASGPRARRREDGRTAYRGGYTRALVVGILLSAGAHALAFEFFPGVKAPDYERVVGEIEAVPVAGKVHVPPPPEPIRRPELPRVSETDVQIEEDVGLVRPADDGARYRLPPPPPAVNAGTWEKPSYIPHDVAPRPDRDELARERLERYYPRRLNEQGVEGIVDLWVRVDEEGDVTRTRVINSSGHEEMDRAAEQVARDRSYLPALNRDKPVAVWVTQRVCFVQLDRGEELPDDADCAALVEGG